jgi:hypothetical protein
VNRDFRLVALVAASLGLIVSLFFALRPDDEPAPSTAPPAATVTTATTAPATTTEPIRTAAEPVPAPEPDVVTVRIAVPADRAPEVRKLSVKRGRDVVLVVSAEVSDHVHLHGYDLMADVAPGKPARIEFTADAAGRFEIELEDRGLEIADLEVRP